MSTIDVNKDGLRIPLWIAGVVFVLFMGWNGWISYTLIDTNKLLVKLQTQIEADTVSPGVQRELQQIRDRMTEADRQRNELLKIAIENQRDIINLTAEVNRSRKP